MGYANRLCEDGEAPAMREDFLKNCRHFCAHVNHDDKAPGLPESRIGRIDG